MDNCRLHLKKEVNLKFLRLDNANFSINFQKMIEDFENFENFDFVYCFLPGY